MSSEDKPIEFVEAKEEDRISRNLLGWLSGYHEIPLSILRIDYEFLDAKESSMSLSTIQGAYIVERFIDGTYTAEYQFKLIYRLRANTPDERLKADELLDGLGDWAVAQFDAGNGPDIGSGLEVQEFEQATRSSLFARMEDGWEDHQIFMRMTYKANPGK